MMYRIGVLLRRVPFITLRYVSGCRCSLTSSSIVGQALKDRDIIEEFLKEDAAELNVKLDQSKHNPKVKESESIDTMKDFFRNYDLDKAKHSEILSSQNSGAFDFLDKLELENDRQASETEVLVEEDLESKYFHEERETMLNIFNKYLGEDEPGSRRGGLDKFLGTGFGTPRSKTDQINELIQSYSSELVTPAPVVAFEKENLALDVAAELHEKIVQSLQPTIKLIESEMSLSEAYDFFEKLSQHQLTLNARDILVPSNVEGRDTLVKTVENASQTNASAPLLNEFTLPILINSIIKTVAVKFQDPQLSLSIFSLLKSDLKMYTVCCNQQTYNEIMRIHWIFNGKSNLYGIEMILLEMTNNGFNGDVTTYNLLEKIIIDYHNMKLGIDLHGGAKRVQPIWNNEDDKRVKNLEKKLHMVGNRLKRESVY